MYNNYGHLLKEEISNDLKSNRLPNSIFNELKKLLIRLDGWHLLKVSPLTHCVKLDCGCQKYALCNTWQHKSKSTIKKCPGYFKCEICYSPGK